MTPSYFPGVGLLTASLLVHGCLLFSVDHWVSANHSLVRLEQQRIIQQQKRDLDLQFVESSPKASPQSPRNTRRISERNALNQDLLRNKTRAEELPRAMAKGLADQLAQRRGNPAQAPSQKVEPNRGGQKKEEASQKPNESQAKAPEKPMEANDVPEFAFPVGAKAPSSAASGASEKPQRAGAQEKSAVQGVAGRDKITTQEMGRVPSRGARLYGMTSFEATGSGMGEYMKNLKERIWLNWFPYLVFNYPQEFRGADAIVSFVIDAKGNVESLKVVENGGDPIFATFCMNAVQRASGFGPLPKEILALVGKDKIELLFGFHYR